VWMVRGWREPSGEEGEEVCEECSARSDGGDTPVESVRGSWM